MKFSTLLCFDFGSRRIGVAVGQTVTGTASPLLTINTFHNKPDWEKIASVIADWQPDAIIVGIPLTMHGTPQEMSDAAERFAHQLEGRFRIPVFGMDERLSTFEARQRTGDDVKLDAVAAQAILESWMYDNRDDEFAPDSGN
ncbi:MAG: Holliday junction resolvase RuvX [Gammaproteobacteria bacterium]